jgi:hypothetical protein
VKNVAILFAIQNIHHHDLYPQPSSLRETLKAGTEAIFGSLLGTQKTAFGAPLRVLRKRKGIQRMQSRVAAEGWVFHTQRCSPLMCPAGS